MDASQRYDKATCTECQKPRDVPWSRLCGFCLAVALGRALRLLK